MKTLLLWDIDGTLISARGAGLMALCDAFRAGFGIESTLEHIELAGRTDRWIFRQMLLAFNLPESEQNLERLREHYLAAIPQRMKERGFDILPGIAEIIAEGTRHPSVVQGLLTGNLRQGAAIKLKPTGLWDAFEFGAFADDSEHRNDLGPHALRRAREQSGIDFALDRVWVIGDTPYDVACGKAIGARTLAIATGRHSVDCLSQTGADAVFANLADHAAFWKTVLPK